MNIYEESKPLHFFIFYWKAYFLRYQIVYSDYNVYIVYQHAKLFLLERLIVSHCTTWVIIINIFYSNKTNKLLISRIGWYIIDIL